MERDLDGHESVQDHGNPPQGGWQRYGSARRRPVRRGAGVIGVARADRRTEHRGHAVVHGLWQRGNGPDGCGHVLGAEHRRRQRAADGQLSEAGRDEPDQLLALGQQPGGHQLRPEQFVHGEVYAACGAELLGDAVRDQQLRHQSGGNSADGHRHRQFGDEPAGRGWLSGGGDQSGDGRHGDLRRVLRGGGGLPLPGHPGGHLRPLQRQRRQDPDEPGLRVMDQRQRPELRALQRHALRLLARHSVGCLQAAGLPDLHQRHRFHQQLRRGQRRHHGAGFVLFRVYRRVEQQQVSGNLQWNRVFSKSIQLQGAPIQQRLRLTDLHPRAQRYAGAGRSLRDWK